jgi:uncharacterized protein
MRYKKLLSVFLIFAGLFTILPMIFFISSCSSKEEAIPEEIYYPAYHGFVNDYANMLTEEWQIKTEQLAADVEKETGCQIAVAIVPSIQGVSQEEYAAGLFKKWGIGKKKEDNGALLLISNEGPVGSRPLRIEVGYGLEGTITDLEAGRIIRDIITPKLKAGDYNTAVYDGVVAIANNIYGKYGKAEVAYSDTIKNIPKKSFTDSKAFPIVIILITLLPWFIIGGAFGVGSLTYYIKTHKCPKCHKIGLIIKQTILVKPTYESPGRAEIEQRCRYCGFYEKKTSTISKLSRFSVSGSSYSSSSSFSSHSISSSSSSSSHSFGGGSSGGGGASGGW